MNNKVIFMELQGASGEKRVECLATQMLFTCVIYREMENNGSTRSV